MKFKTCLGVMIVLAAGCLMATNLTSGVSRQFLTMGFLVCAVTAVVIVFLNELPHRRGLLASIHADDASVVTDEEET